MALDTKEAAIFSMTPPPSEFDEFDKTGLLTCSPSHPVFTYPSPTPSSRDHTSSVSSESLFMLPGMSALSAEPQSHDLQHLPFENTSTSDSASFFPLPPVTDPSMAFSGATSSGANAASYNMYEQNNWYHFPNYSQPTPMMPYEPSHSTSFGGYGGHSTQPSMANIIPPTPQDMEPTPFDFNAPPLGTNGHLVASPSFSHISHPSRSSISSLSRSCSPIPSLSKSLSGDSTMLRPNVRSHSTSSNSSLNQYGIPVTDTSSMMHTGMPPSSVGSPGGTQAWRCAYPGCTSRATFTRGCDLRKHYNRHSKHLFCRVDGCPQSEAAAAARAKPVDQPLTGGFSSKKDRARHEAKHSPSIKCEWRGADGEECARVFSRMDNMKDHVRRIHHKGHGHQPQKSGLAQSSGRK